MFVPTCPGITTATRTWGAWARRSSMSASEKAAHGELGRAVALGGTPGPSDAHKPFTLLVLTRIPLRGSR